MNSARADVVVIGAEQAGLSAAGQPRHSSMPRAPGPARFWPIYPGQSAFRGRQLHVADYVSAEEFAGRHVIVVGGGISAVGLLEISRVTTTSWFTRREPLWRDEEFDARAGHDAVALVEDRIRRGLPPQSVVLADGGFLPAGVILWATGSRAELEHLASPAANPGKLGMIGAGNQP